MGDRKNLAAELDFPEAAIQRIQGCLSPKEAASTVVLSKSWYNAWLSRPLLHFDQQYFPSADGFLSYVRRSLERYHRSYLKLESFSLRMNDSSSHNHATEFIARAVILGATDFNLEFSPPVQEYVLPRELLELESLVCLSAVGCTISGLDVLGPQLKTLSLYKVCIGGAMLFPGDWRTIILDCPGLENLILSDCEGFDVVDVARMLTYVNSISVIRVGNRPTSKDIPRISFGPFGFFRLTSLLLERLDTDSMLFSNFSVMFPYVKDLTLRHCDGCLDFRISSTSIHYISLAHTQRLKIRLDAPNLVKFKFSGATSIPELSVVSASRKWESDITLSCWRNLRFMWFLELNEFLLSLSTSKITLDIDLLRVSEIERLPNVRPYSKPMVANLMLGGSSLTSDLGVALMENVCWGCRPDFINLCMFTTNDWRSITNLDWRIQCNQLLLHLSKLLMYPASWHGLLQANVEILDEEEQWQCVDWLTFLNDVARTEKDVQIRFRLRWPED